LNAPQPITKDQIEAMCRVARATPEKRLTVGDYDLLISDGFSLPPHFAYRRFGIDADEFKNGCYVTVWWLMKGDDRLYGGGRCVFDAFHDPEYDMATKKRARINTAIKTAEQFVSQLRKVKLNG